MRPARLLLALGVLFCAGATTRAQVNIQPTPAPLVTAANEVWYRTGEPLAFAGSLYYPAGAAIHFLPNEMVRSGFYRGVPLYSRTTIEPYSIIFVPVDGGLMQPYERRRDLDLAGTQGSRAPAISPLLAPSVGPTSAASAFGAPSPAMVQAAAPPVIGEPAVADEPLPLPAPTGSVPQAVATTGRVAAASPAPFRIRRGSANAIYIEYDNARWFIAGPAVSVDVRSLTQVGESRGFPVYAARSSDTIYVPIARGMDTVVPYSRQK